MKLTNEFQPIRDWATERGIYVSGDLKTQTLKLLEEAGELARAILKDDRFEAIDAIGDCVVVLTNLSNLMARDYNDPNVSIENCINTAYEVIANRTGKMVDGTFVRDV